MENKTKTIGTLYFVLAGFSLLALLFIPFHYQMMTAFMTIDFPVEEGQPDPKIMFEKIIGPLKYMYIIGGIVCSLFFAAALTTGFFFYRKKNRNLCIIGAAICCLSFPFGTALGVWALLVLFDENIKSEFVS